MSTAKKIRIIGGRWRSRQIAVPDLPGVRPTPNRVRETLFNWLQNDIVDAVCLDAYAGSGALGLEALSRGAKAVTLVESDRLVLQQLRMTLKQLQAESVQLVAGDFMVVTLHASAPFDLVFLDPPFHRDALTLACKHLVAQNWLAPQAKIYVEHAADEVDPLVPETWVQLKRSVAGDVVYSLYQST